jgi:hypothetical protein
MKAMLRKPRREDAQSTPRFLYIAEANLRARSISKWIRHWERIDSQWEASTKTTPEKIISS